MKVEEAKTKVCPFILSGRYEWEKSGEPLHIKCICGDCMAWRWDETSIMSLEGGGFDYSEAEGYCARIG